MTMKLVYEASNALEAHMILNLLEQDGLSARIDGELLQGGVGELQAIGIVRVMVDESDYPTARQIIEQWDARQTSQNDAVQTRKISSLGAGFLGFLFGVGVMIVYYHTPVSDERIVLQPEITGLSVSDKCRELR